MHPLTSCTQRWRRSWKVLYFGKPDQAHFHACISRLNGDSAPESASGVSGGEGGGIFEGIPQERIVHVGDSMMHDIKGANQVGG